MPLEIVVDGKAVARKTIVADGQVRDLEFDIPVERSSWIAARILPSSHTNPIFVIVSGKPMRPLRASAEWCLAAVDQCWTQKAPKISARELPDARQAYDHAREVSWDGVRPGAQYSQRYSSRPQFLLTARS